MGGLLTLMAGGLLKGVGDGMIADAKDKRDAAIEAAKAQAAKDAAIIRANSTTEAAKTRADAETKVGAANNDTSLNIATMNNKTSSDNNRRNNATSRDNNAATNSTSRDNNRDNNSEKTNPKPLTQNQALETARQTYKDNLTAGIPMKDDNGDDIPADEWISDYADRLVTKSSASNPTPITGKIAAPASQAPYVPTSVSGPVGGGLLTPSGPAAAPASIVAPAAPPSLQVPSTVIRYDQNGNRIQ